MPVRQNAVETGDLDPRDAFIRGSVKRVDVRLDNAAVMKVSISISVQE